MEEEQAIDALAALAQESRLRVFRSLVRAGERGKPAGEIAASLGIPGPTLSFHLKELARAGLISDRRHGGRSIVYSLSIAGIRGLLAFLLDDCCQGRPEICQPDAGGRAKREACCPAPRRRRIRQR